MADGVTYPISAGIIALTDDCTVGHAQIVKLGVSADGSAAVVQADGNGVLVNVSNASMAVTASLNAGTNNIGDVDVLTIPAPLNVVGTGLEATALRVTIASDSTGLISVDDNGGSLTVDGTVAISGSVPVTDNAGSLTVDAPVGTPVFVRLSDGAAAIATLPVSLASVPSHAVTNAGTFAVQAASAGDVAHDGVDSGNPVKVGYRAIAHGTNPTAVAAADRTDALASRAGIPWVIGGHPNIVTLEYATTGAATDVALVTVSAGAKIVVTQIQAVTDEATTVGVGLRVGFGATNTPTTTGVVLTHPGMVPGSGISRGDGGGMLGVGADGEDLRITSEAPTSGSLRVLVSYYTIES